MDYIFNRPGVAGAVLQSPLWILGPIFSDKFLWRILNSHRFLTVKTVDLNPAVRAKPIYQLWAVTKYQTNLPYTLPDQFYFFNQSFLVMRTLGQPLATIFKGVRACCYKTLKQIQKIPVFLATSENLNRQSLLQSI